MWIGSGSWLVVGGQSGKAESRKRRCIGLNHRGAETHKARNEQLRNLACRPWLMPSSGQRRIRILYISTLA